MTRILPLSLLALLIALAAPAEAQTYEAYSDARFDALQRAGALVLVDVHADWCPTGAQQQRVIAAYQEARPNVPLHVLRVDFDDQKDAVRRFRAPRQSTLFLFEGGERVWFAVAETRRDAIFSAIDEAAAGSSR